MFSMEMLIDEVHGYILFFNVKLSYPGYKHGYRGRGINAGYHLPIHRTSKQFTHTTNRNGTRKWKAFPCNVERTEKNGNVKDLLGSSASYTIGDWKLDLARQRDAD